MLGSLVQYSMGGGTLSQQVRSLEAKNMCIAPSIYYSNLVDGFYVGKGVLVAVNEASAWAADGCGKKVLIKRPCCVFWRQFQDLRTFHDRVTPSVTG